MAFTLRGSCAPARERAATASGATGAVATGPLLLAVLGIPLFIALANNGAFFQNVMTATAGGEHRIAILLVMFLLISTTLTLVLSLAVGRYLLKSVAALLLISGAGSGYFMSSYGIVIDESMIRNVVETDVREASPLLTADFALHLALFGVLPAALVLLLPLGRIGWKRDLVTRTGALSGSLLLLGISIYANFGPVSFFGHENHALRMRMNPIYPLYSLYRYAARDDDAPPAARTPLTAAVTTRVTQGGKPTLFVFVMGETARADRFSLNGYERVTNRYTRDRGIVNFPDVSSCGTSTADSLPCIFSRMTRANFSHADFARNESLFQTLGRLGVDVRWRDNSTGCKEICGRDDFEDLAGAQDPKLCRDNVCIDEILLEDFSALIADNSGDRFIVLHQRGSHGPAYYTDTPAWARAWLPQCDRSSLQDCSRTEIGNAYDNTILYTDYFLSRVIDLLEREQDRYRTAMLYVSDHGESLGEKGLYLHGLPYALAPTEQTRVPMIFWASDAFYLDQGIDTDCLLQRAARPTSHDAIFHSLLPIFDIESPAYDPQLDIFASCRQARSVLSRL